MRVLPDRCSAKKRAEWHATIDEMSTQPLQFLLLFFSGWVNRRQADVIDYLRLSTTSQSETTDSKRLRSPELAPRGVMTLAA